MKKVLFFDVDGTLLTPKKRIVEPATLEVLKELSIIPNIDLYLSSGRGRDTLNDVEHIVPYFTGLNLANGGGKTSFSSFSTDGRMNVVNPLVKINGIGELAVYGTNYKVLYNLDSDDECDSFISYVNTRFIRFLIFMGVCGQSITNDETWRFVPDPGAFDHIFTDQELYQKYGLTDDEIKIVESVIKERK